MNNLVTFQIRIVCQVSKCYTVYIFHDDIKDINWTNNTLCIKSSKYDFNNLSMELLLYIAAVFINGDQIKKYYHNQIQCRYRKSAKWHFYAKKLN